MSLPSVEKADEGISQGIGYSKAVSDIPWINNLHLDEDSLVGRSLGYLNRKTTDKRGNRKSKKAKLIDIDCIENIFAYLKYCLKNSRYYQIEL